MEKKQKKLCIFCLDKGELNKATVPETKFLSQSLAGQSCVSYILGIGAVSFSSPFSLVLEEAKPPHQSSVLHTLALANLLSLYLFFVYYFY